MSLRDYLFHEEPGITLYCGDALDVVALLPPVDALVTDPPYGVGFAGKATKHTVAKPGGYTLPDDGNVGPEVVGRLLGGVRHAAVFPGIRQMYRYPEPQDIGCVYCPSGAGIGRFGFVCFHPVLFYGTRASTTLRPTSIVSFDTAQVDGHPCPKPVRWLTWVMDLVSLPGHLVVDPFAGSGTTLRAAKDTGRRAIGIEIEPRYCEIAVKRLRQEVLRLDPEPAPAAGATETADGASADVSTAGRAFPRMES